jgi:hypothetical protein
MSSGCNVVPRLRGWVYGLVSLAASLGLGPAATCLDQLRQGRRHAGRKHEPGGQDTISTGEQGVA